MNPLLTSLLFSSGIINFADLLVKKFKINVFSTKLSTPFSGFERYAIHLRLEGTERKTLQIEVESPELRVGADFDYVFNSATDFVSKASIRTPFAGYESFTIHLSNRLGEASYSVNAEAIFAKYGMAATIEGVLRNNGFQVSKLL